MTTRRQSLWSLGAALVLVSCGGGGDPPVELKIDGAPALATTQAQITLTGTSFIPAGSTCPPSSEYIIIGTIGPNTITVRNDTTNATGPGFTQLWVCNAGESTIDWASNPVTLAVGANSISVTMSAGSRSSSASITVTRNPP